MRIVTSLWFRIIAVCLTLCLVAGTLVASFPEQTLGRGIAAVSGDVSASATDIINGDMPSGSTITDRDGNVIAEFYDQRRTPVAYGDINPVMVKAIVAIEDRRFFEHDGVDWKGIARAAVANLSGGGISQGASTLTQQLVKNYLLYTADDEAEAGAATEQTYLRKMREMTLASEVDKKLTKEEIVTRYLNLVAYGEGAYGIEEAAKTYFGTPAKELTLPQAALLAGLVQAPSLLDPYVDPEAATERRNQVLTAMEAAGFASAGDVAAAKNADLGVLPAANIPDSGCLTAGDNGFFCDFVVGWLADNGIDNLTRGGYTITTTLDPRQQSETVSALRSNVDPYQPGVAETAAFIEPGGERPIRAFATSRPYGLGEGQTTLPLVSSTVGNGAGSTFKVFTAAAALNQGLGIFNHLDVPARVEAEGLGSSGTDDCPVGKFCVTNVGTYPQRMTMQDALAQSPNTPFINLASLTGNPAVVDMAVKLGLRSYETDGTAERMRSNGSFTLGVNGVSTVEMANVAATIASDGSWCQPRPVAAITAGDKQVSVPTTECEQVVEPQLAQALGQGLSKDVVDGTAADTAKAAGFRGVMAGKTGTTDNNSSASFLGFDRHLAGFVYAFGDSGESPLCTSPLRQCDSGDLYGAMEPARTWFAATETWRAENTPELPAASSGYVSGTSPLAAKTVVGMERSEGITALRQMGFTIAGVREVESDDSGIVSVDFVGDEVAGGRVQVTVAKPRPEPAPEPTSAPSQPSAPSAPQAPAPIPQVPDLGSVLGGLLGF